jgi:hypothetical protein
VTPIADRVTGERHKLSGRNFTGYQLVGAQGRADDGGRFVAVRTAWSTPASDVGLIAPAAAHAARRAPSHIARAKPSASTTRHAWL